MSTKHAMKAISATLLTVSLFASPLEAVDGSLFLGTVGPVERIDGVTPGVDPYDAHAIDYVNFRSSTIDPFFNANFDPVIEVYTPPAGVGDVTIPIGSEVRMYLISEEAGYSNQLGFVTGYNFDLTHPDNANSLIFDNIETIVDPAGPPNDILRENDYVVIDDLTTELLVMDFFLIQDGADADANDGLVERVWWSEPSLNDDGLQHVYIQPFFPPGAIQYYLIAIEDLNRNGNINDDGGSTSPSDYPIDNTDYVGVLQVITPEPQTYLLLGSFLAFVAYYKRKKAHAKA